MIDNTPEKYKVNAKYTGIGIPDMVDTIGVPIRPKNYYDLVVRQEDDLTISINVIFKGVDMEVSIVYPNMYRFIEDWTNISLKVEEKEQE